MSRLSSCLLVLALVLGSVVPAGAKGKTEKEFKALVEQYVQKVAEADWEACAAFHHPDDLDSIASFLKEVAKNSEDSEAMMMGVSMLSGTGLYQMVLTQFLGSMKEEPQTEMFLSFILQSSSKPTQILGVVQNDDELFAVCRVWNNSLLPDQASQKVISGRVGDDGKLYIGLPPVFTLFKTVMKVMALEQQ